MATELNWQADINHAFGEQSTDDLRSKWGVWYITHQMLGVNTGGTVFTQGLWSVDSSCNSLVAGAPGDAVDRWGSSFNAANIVNAAPGAPHSWFVLTRTFSGGAGTTCYLIVDMAYGPEVARPYFYLAKTQPTGGTTLARPTSPDEVRLFDPTGIPAQAPDRIVSVTTNTKIANMMLSSRGDVWFYSSSPMAGPGDSFYAVLAVTELMDTRVGDLFPVCGMWVGTGTLSNALNQSGTNTIFTADIGMGFYGRTSDNQYMAKVYPTFPSVANQNTAYSAGVLSFYFPSADYASNKFSELPMYAFSAYPNAIAQYGEVRGRFADFKAASGVLSPFTVRPAAPPFEYVKVGNTWAPWGGTQSPFR